MTIFKWNYQWQQSCEIINDNIQGILSVAMCSSSECANSDSDLSVPALGDYLISPTENSVWSQDWEANRRRTLLLSTMEIFFKRWTLLLLACNLLSDYGGSCAVQIVIQLDCYWISTCVTYVIMHVNLRATCEPRSFPALAQYVVLDVLCEMVEWGSKQWFN
jgi:hypothetical protein